MQSGLQMQVNVLGGTFQRFDAANAVLNQEGAWVPETNDQNQWLQIDLHRQLLVSGVVIQGRPDTKKWVTRYRVKYALDRVSWEFVKDENTSLEVCNLRQKKIFYHYK